MGNMWVSSCRCCVLLSVVHPVEILFIILSSLWKTQTFDFAGIILIVKYR